jgi:hypothetical protein
MTNSEPRQPTRQVIWHVFVGWLLGLFVANLLGVFLVQFAHVDRRQVGIRYLIHFSLGERLLLASLPLVSAAVLVQKRPYISLGMLISALMAWMMQASEQYK